MTPASESSVTNIPSSSVHQYHRPTEAQLRWAQFHHKKDAATVRDRIEKMWLYPPSDNDDNSSVDDSETEFTVVDSDDADQRKTESNDLNQQNRSKKSIHNPKILISRGRRALLQKSKMKYIERLENLRNNGFRHPVESIASSQDGQCVNQTSSRVFRECKVSADDITNHLQQQQYFKRASARHSFDTTGGSGSRGDLKYVRRVGALKNPAPFLVSGQTPLDRGASWLHNLYLPNSTKVSSSTTKGHSARHSLDNPIYDIHENDSSICEVPMSCQESFIEMPHQHINISNKVNDLEEKIRKARYDLPGQSHIIRCVTDDDNSNLDHLRTPVSLEPTTTASSEEFFHFQHLLGSYDDSFEEDEMKPSTKDDDTILFHREKSLWTEFAELVPTVDTCARHEIDEMNFDKDTEAISTRSDNLVVESHNDCIECPYSNTIVEFITSAQISTVPNPIISLLEEDNLLRECESLVELSNNGLASADKTLLEWHDVHVDGSQEAKNIVENQEIAPMSVSVFHACNEITDLKPLKSAELAICHSDEVISSQCNAYVALHETYIPVVEKSESGHQEQKLDVHEYSVLHVSSSNTNQSVLSQTNVIDEGISTFAMEDIQSSDYFTVDATDEKQLRIHASEMVEHESNTCDAETYTTNPLEDFKFDVGEQFFNMNLAGEDLMLRSVDPNEGKDIVVSDHTDSEEEAIIKSSYVFVDGPDLSGPNHDLSSGQRSDDEEASIIDVLTKLTISNSSTLFCGNEINDVDAGSVSSLINQMSLNKDSESVAAQSKITTIVNEGMVESKDRSSCNEDESVKETTEERTRSSSNKDEGVVLSLDESSHRSSCMSEVDIKQSQQSVVALRKPDLVHIQERFPIVIKQKSRCYIPLNSTANASKRVVATIVESNPRWEKRFMM